MISFTLKYRLLIDKIFIQCPCIRLFSFTWYYFRKHPYFFINFFFIIFKVEFWVRKFLLQTPFIIALLTFITILKEKRTTKQKPKREKKKKEIKYLDL